MENGEIRLQYKLMDAWCQRIYTIRINLTSSQPVHYWRTGRKRKSLTLTPEAVEKIRQLLQNPDLYGFRELESEAQRIEVLDGTISVISYTDGIQAQELYVSNLGTYAVDREKWPHAAAVRIMLLTLKDILEKAGVPAAFFAEGWV